MKINGDLAYILDLEPVKHFFVIPTLSHFLDKETASQRDTHVTDWSYIVSRVSDSRSVVSDSVTPWTVARQAPLSMEFSRQEY